MALPGGVTVEELRNGHLNVQGKDAFLELLLASASEFVAGETRRNLTPALDPDDPVDVTIRTRGRRFLRLPDAREVTAVVLDDVALIAEEDYDLHQANRGETFVKLEVLRHSRTAVITGRFGLDPVPEDLRDAIYTLAARNYHEKDAMYGDVVAPSEEGGAVSFFRQVPPRVRAILTSWQVPADRMGLT